MSDFPFTTLQLAWIKELNEGNHKQETGFLRAGNAFCCLGVAAEFVLKKEGIPDSDGHYSYSGDFSILVDWKELHLEDSSGKLRMDYAPRYSKSALTDMNDSGWNFKSIAKFIQDNPRSVFTNGDAT